MSLVVGVDIGSITAKAVVLDGESNVIATHVLYEGIVNREAAEQCLDETLTDAGVSRSGVDFIVTTGYGRELVSFGDLSVTEISCHADGAHFLYPEVRTVIDIGGQDSKVIGLDDNGNVLNFRMNDRCAAGTGRFLEVMANALRLRLEDIGELALQSTSPANVSSTCTVFAESEIVSLSAQSCQKADIVAGMHEAIGRRVSGMVRSVGLRERIAMTGGVAKNVGAVAVLGRILETTLLVPSDPQIIGALGAARLALRHLGGVPSEPARAPATASGEVPADCGRCAAVA